MTTLMRPADRTVHAIMATRCDGYSSNDYPVAWNATAEGATAVVADLNRRAQQWTDRLDAQDAACDAAANILLAEAQADLGDPFWDRHVSYSTCELDYLGVGA